MSLIKTHDTEEKHSVTVARVRAVRRSEMQVVGVYCGLACLWIAMSLSSPNFLTVPNIRNILISASTLSLIGAGLTVVLVVGEIDLSIAALQAFTGSIATVLIVYEGVPWLLGVMIGIGVSVAAGALSGLASVVGRLPTFITTLAMMGIVQGTAYLVTDDQPVVGLPNALVNFGSGEVAGVPDSVLLVVACYIILQFVLTRTVFGLQVFAVGGDRLAATRAGINWRRTVVAVMALSGLMSGIAGIIISARLGSGSGEYGSSDLLPAIAGVIIGGASLSGGSGSLLGTVGGIMIVVSVNDSLTLLNVSQFWQQVAVGIIILAAVLIDQAVKGRLLRPRL